MPADRLRLEVRDASKSVLFIYAILRRIRRAMTLAQDGAQYSRQGDGSCANESWGYALKLCMRPVDEIIDPEETPLDIAARLQNGLVLHATGGSFEDQTIDSFQRKTGRLP
jgi:hypothetical protein